MNRSNEELFGDSPKPAGRPSGPPPPVPDVSKSSDFADDLMQDYNNMRQQQGDFSMYSDEPAVAKPAAEPTGGLGYGSDPFGISSVTQPSQGLGKDPEFEALEAQFAQQEMGSDFGLGGGPKTEAGGAGGDLGFGGNQGLGQYERVSPNMMGYGFEATSEKIQVSSTLQQVPIGDDLLVQQTVTTTATSSSTVLRPGVLGLGGDDDEDDFDRDSFSHSHASQPSKLSDSLENLKDVTKGLPSAVKDHFGGGGFGYDDEFEKDSLASKPLSSSRLSDSLEVLKDSPPKETMDESLMDLEELPSSKNSVNSISPNDVPEEVHGLHGEIPAVRDAARKISGSDQSGSPFENLSEEIRNMPSSNRDDFPETSDFSSGFEGSGVGQTASHSSTASTLPEEVSSVRDSDFLNSAFRSDQDETMDMFESSRVTDVGSPRPKVEDNPPPVPPHRNLPADDPFGGFSSMTESNIMGQTNPLDYNDYPISQEHEQEVESELNARRKETPAVDLLSAKELPGSNSHLMTASLIMSSSLDDVQEPNMYESEESSAINDLNIADTDVNQKSVTDELDDFLPKESKQPEASPKRESPVFSSRSDNLDLINQMDSEISHNRQNEPVLEPDFSASRFQQDYHNQEPQPSFDSFKTEEPKFGTAASFKEPSFEAPKSAFSEPVFATPQSAFKEPVFQTPQSGFDDTMYGSAKSTPKPQEPMFEDFAEPEPEPPKVEPRKQPELFQAAEEPFFSTPKDSPKPAHKEPVFETFKQPEEPMFQDFAEPEPPKPEPKKESPAPPQPKIQLTKEEPPKTPKEEPKPEPPKPEPKKEAPKPKAEPPKPKPVRKNNEDVVINEEVELLLNTFDPRCWFQPEKLHPEVSELVYWRDPKKSGVVFGSALLVLILFSCMSVISVIAYTGLAILSGTLAFRLYKQVMQAVQKTNEGHPFKDYLDAEVTVSDEKAQEVSTAVVERFNGAVTKLRSLFLVEDIVDSVKFGVVLYLLTYIGSWFNGLTLVILGLIALFATPKVYEQNKTVIDQYLELAQAKYSEVMAKVSAAIPFGKKDKAQ